MFTVTVNGEPKEFEGEVTVEDLVRSLELSGQKVAVEVNLEVVRKVSWPAITLKDKDRIEVVHFVGGG